jgi:hypothetical protein
MMTDYPEELKRRFNHHPPQSGRTADKHVEIRAAFLDLATKVSILAPNSREQSLALTKLEEAMFWANAAIARNQEFIV